jgi:hypothetical protein
MPLDLDPSRHVTAKPRAEPRTQSYSPLSLVGPSPLFFNVLNVLNVLNANLPKCIIHYRNVYFNDYGARRQWKLVNQEIHHHNKPI